ncbi:MAG: NAD-dependent epimerase/dehydratase family protein [Sandaracinaceae bacterium]
MRVAVTGGAGRLGNALVRALSKRGDEVRVLDLGDPRSLAGLGVDLRQGSVTDRAEVDALVDGVDRVFHVAAKIDLERDRDGSTWRVNVEGTRVVAEACRAFGARMVHVSSHAALDRLPWTEPLDERRPLALRDKCDYHRSKAHAERLVLQLADDGLDATVVNPGTLTGPLDFEPSLLGRALMDLHRGKIPLLLDAITDYADVRDVAAATLAAAEHGRRGERYLLTGDVLDMRAMLALLGRVTQKRMPKTVLPLWVGWAALPLTLAAGRLRGETPVFTAGTLRAAVSNVSVCRDKATRELGFTLRPMDTSFADAFSFYREQGWL